MIKNQRANVVDKLSRIVNIEAYEVSYENYQLVLKICALWLQ